MEPSRRQKWLAVAQRFPTMSPEEQVRVQERMLAWVKLSPEQRMAARDKYKGLKKASPEKQAVLKQKWQEYENLPQDEKARLKALQAQKRAEAARKNRPTAATFAPSLPKPQLIDGFVPLAPAVPPPAPVRR